MIERILSNGQKLLLDDNCQLPTLELSLFHFEQPAESFNHLKNFIDIWWNERFPDSYMWNDWTELMQRKFCEEAYVTVTGAGASWKTTSAGVYALTRWYADPSRTVVILTSTTRDGLRRRIWKEVTRYYNFDQSIGHIVPSRDCIQWKRGSDDAGIFGIALDRGEIDKAIGKIIGFHAPRVIVVVDEMPYTSGAIVEACNNLASGCEKFQFIGLGNADDQLDEHGRMCEPADGWDSITPETEIWRTKRGVCIHLDCYASPNVKAGRTVYPGLLTQRDIDTTIEHYGENSPQFWQMRRGFWAPEGIAKTVLTTATLIRYHAMEKAVWIADFKVGAVLDPSFGGDDPCVLRFPKCGEIETDEGQRLLVIDCGEVMHIKPDVPLTEEPLEHQIVRQVKMVCENRGIPPEMVAYDATGAGGPLGAIFAREWSHKLLAVEFGGRASDRPVSEVNPRKCFQEYYNRVTELWFLIRVLTLNGQIRGMDRIAAQQFCKRLYDTRGLLTIMETKKDMKSRIGRSPDEADTVAIAGELFRTRMNLVAVSGVIAKKAKDDFTKFAIKMDVASDPQNYLVDSLEDSDLAPYSNF